MRATRVLLFLIGMAGLGFAEEDGVVDAAGAAGSVGSTVVMVDVVAQVVQKEGGPVFLNFGGVFPKETVAAVIFSAAVPKFPDVKDLEGQKVRITGLVSDYQGHPRIILRDPEQLVAEKE